MGNEITLAAVGDVMLGDSPQVFGYGVGSRIRHDGPLHPFAHVRERLASADITVGNLEVVISGFDPARTPFAERIYRGQPNSVDGLVDAGFDILSLCTNHMMQHGQGALDETIDLLDKAGIDGIGAMRSGGVTTNISTLERKGLRFVFLAYNFRPQQYFVAPPAWPEPNFETIHRDVLAHRPAADVLVVSLHWGDEFIDRPSTAQVELAHRLVDAGVDVILGHHPHILQGVERYHGSVIAYSLGNFVYDQWQERLRRSAILWLTIRGPGDVDFQLEPVRINKYHQPMLLEGVDRSDASAHLGSLNDKIGGVSDAGYRNQLLAENQRFRREIYLHYLTQFWRSNPRDFIANVGGIITRRI